jgi:protein PhnA
MSGIEGPPPQPFEAKLPPFPGLRPAGEAGQPAGFPFNPSPSMPNPTCPACSLDDVLSHPDHWECVTCGHEWPKAAAPEVARVVKDANGNLLSDGDTVVLIKDLKLRGGSGVLKGGTKVKNIRLVDGDHEIDCKIEGSAMALKACFVKKA